ncbi:DUF2953 domain-containing protein [Bacillaceae bacterium]
MKVMAIVLGFSFLLLVLLCATSVTVGIHYRRAEEDDRLTIDVKAWHGIIRFRHEIPAVELRGLLQGIRMKQESQIGKSGAIVMEKNTIINREEIRKRIRAFRRLLRNVRGLKPIMTSFVRRVRLEKLVWQTRIGSGDAADTGILTGVAWSVKAMLVGTAAHRMDLRCYPRFSVSPAFGKRELCSELSCIVRFRLGHAILAGMRILLNLRKGRERTWQNTPFKA